jgi:hypothetical protein
VRKSSKPLGIGEPFPTSGFLIASVLYVGRKIEKPGASATKRKLMLRPDNGRASTEKSSPTPSGTIISLLLITTES